MRAILALAQNAAVREASLAIVGGVVWAPGRPRASALAVHGDRVVAVGADREIRSLIGARTRVIEARGGTILPAFNDAHVHFLMASRSLGELDLFGAKTQPEVERRIAAHVASAKGDWVVGRGWFYSAFPGGMPTVDLLDRLVADRPAYIESFDAHTGWANSKALALAGVATAGVLKEAEMLGVTRHLPARSAAEDLEALRRGMRMAASRGIASVQEAGDGQDELRLWASLREAGELTMRVRLAFDMVPGQSGPEWQRRLDEYEELARRWRADRWLSTGILKAFADGVVESRTAAMLEPFEGTSERGAPLWGPEELALAVRAADARGWQVQVHAIGDAAIRQALSALQSTTPGRRHRVEHIEVPGASDIGRFAQFGVVASMQPQHADPGLTEVWRRNLGAERAARGWPWRTLLASGARLAFGTDWPVVPLEPFTSLRIATGDHAAQLISIEEAVAAWSLGAAYAEHMEAQKGSLAVGMLADIAVLDRDLASTPQSELASIKIEATAVGGRLVYES
ncbi:MAG TPA: amidohydrolase [Candidatus Dormibacteraeota bacterium]|nr:amidohydrolase [Candidatus Dormibacteraeota bacterium]